MKGKVEAKGMKPLLENDAMPVLIKAIIQKDQWWRRQDLNLRTLARTDLQSVAIDHSATSPQSLFSL